MRADTIMIINTKDFMLILFHSDDFGRVRYAVMVTTVVSVDDP
jgi:hypothetical protein